MGSKKLKSRLGWLEGAFYIGGVALLAVFILIRLDAEKQREEGVEAFRQAMEAEVQVQDPESGENVLSTVAAPNQELWNRKRIAEYEKTLQIKAEPPLAIMTIDKIGLQVPVYNGTDEFNLNRGVGRIIGTADVDSVGNLGIAGHRDGFFRGLKDISIGDRIELQTTRGTMIYAVSSITIVDPSDISVLASTTERTMTLVTCYPFYYVGHAPKRYIVTATAEHLLASN